MSLNKNGNFYIEEDNNLFYIKDFRNNIVKICNNYLDAILELKTINNIVTEIHTESFKNNSSQFDNDVEFKPKIIRKNEIKQEIIDTLDGITKNQHVSQDNDLNFSNDLFNIQSELKEIIKEINSINAWRVEFVDKTNSSATQKLQKLIYDDLSKRIEESETKTFEQIDSLKNGLSMNEQILQNLSSLIESLISEDNFKTNNNGLVENIDKLENKLSKTNQIIDAINKKTENLISKTTLQKYKREWLKEALKKYDNRYLKANQISSLLDDYFNEKEKTISLISKPESLNNASIEELEKDSDLYKEAFIELQEDGTLNSYLNKLQGSSEENGDK